VVRKDEGARSHRDRNEALRLHPQFRIETGAEAKCSGESGPL